MFQNVLFALQQEEGSSDCCIRRIPSRQQGLVKVRTQIISVCGNGTILEMCCQFSPRIGQHIHLMLVCTVQQGWLASKDVEQRHYKQYKVKVNNQDLTSIA